MDKYIGKKYKLKSQENFEEYLKFIGIGFTKRKLALAMTPTACLTKNEDGTYTFTNAASLATTIIKFKPGEEIEEERADGSKARSVVTFEGDNLIQIQTDGAGRVSKHVRAFSPDAIIATTTAEGWSGTMVRRYELCTS